MSNKKGRGVGIDFVNFFSCRRHLPPSTFLVPCSLLDILSSEKFHRQICNTHGAGDDPFANGLWVTISLWVPIDVSLSDSTTTRKSCRKRPPKSRNLPHEQSTVTPELPPNHCRSRGCDHAVLGLVSALLRGRTEESQRTVARGLHSHR